MWLDRLGAKLGPCHCVLRKIFRLCLARYFACTNGIHFAHTKFETMQYNVSRPGGRRSASWGRKNEEYAADFWLVSQRMLSDNPEQLKLFQLHFLGGEEWEACAREMGIDRGNFFHMVYRVMERLGRRFAEVQPYCLYPLDEYFHGGSKHPHAFAAPRLAPTMRRVTELPGSPPSSLGDAPAVPVAMGCRAMAAGQVAA